MAAPSLHRCERGAMAVEFALVLPVLLLFLLGVVEAGRAYLTWSSMQFAVEEAARYALAQSTVTSAQVSSYAQARMSTASTTGAVITVTMDTSTVTVTATTAFQSVAQGLLPFDPLTLTATARTPRS